MTYNFDVKRETKNFEVQVDTAAKYGYFEHKELGDGCCGGLWFDVQEGVLNLVDYDGVFELRMEVVTAIRDMGFNVSTLFEPD